MLVLGGGLSGVGVAYTLARAGWKHVTVVERGPELGGLAGSFERNGHSYPLGYHHILHRDKTLLYFLDRIGALPQVRWRKIRMFFRVQERLYDLGHPWGFLRFPMALSDKLRFVRLMLRAFNKQDWSDWELRSGAELVDRWAGPGVREAIFDPLSQLKYQLDSDEVSAAWLGARLYFREGSAPLGYIPHDNWTTVLCQGVSRLLDELNVGVRLKATVAKVRTDRGRITEVELSDGERIGADLVVSTIPTEIYTRMVPEDDTPEIASITYTALLSTICATPQSLAPDFYWMNFASLDRSAGGIFRLSSLNPTIGGPGETCLNFVNHLRTRDDPMFLEEDESLMARYLDDFQKVFDFELEPSWFNIARVPMYSPIFYRGYRNPAVRSARMKNVYFAGNYRSFPSVASTGTALASGLEAGEAILADHGQTTDLPAAVEGFRLHSKPRGTRDE